MTLQQLSFIEGEGRFKIEINATLTGRGISILLTGGESPHVGGVVLCVPRPSMAGTGTSSDTWVLPVPGHKDTEVAKSVAELICRETGQVTAVTCGIHVDKASPNELGSLQENSMKAAKALVQKFREGKNA